MKQAVKRDRKQKTVISIILFIAILFSSLQTGFITASALQGDGSVQNPYLISTPSELAVLRNYTGYAHSGKYFKLTTDIDLTDYLEGSASGWIPIGENNYPNYFSGNFDGNGHVIRGLWINRPAPQQGDDDYVGLFGYVNSRSVIQNLGIELADAGITGSGYVGSLAGYIAYGQVNNCYVTGGSDNGVTCYGQEGTGESVGGLIGYTKEAYVNDSYAECAVSIINAASSGVCIGGLIGRFSSKDNDTGVINCYATGNVFSSSTMTGMMIEAGGLIGACSAGYITDSFATGSVFVEHIPLEQEDFLSFLAVGGLMGTGKILSASGCFAYGDITVKGNDVCTWSGGFAGALGDRYNTIINKCYANGDVIIETDGTHPYTEWYLSSVGGFTGVTSGGISIANCYASGNIYEQENLYAHPTNIGGIAGRQIEGDSVISNCYYNGQIFSRDMNLVGAITGQVDDGSEIIACFYDKSLAGLLPGTGNGVGIPAVEVYGKTTAQMKNKTTFTVVGWDFTTEWYIIPNITYPLLRIF